MSIEIVQRFCFEVCKTWSFTLKSSLTLRRCKIKEKCQRGTEDGTELDIRKVQYRLPNTG